jgi:hypothetical protein
LNVLFNINLRLIKYKDDIQLFLNPDKCLEHNVLILYMLYQCLQKNPGSLVKDLLCLAAEAASGSHDDSVCHVRNLSSQFDAKDYDDPMEGTSSSSCETKVRN